MEERKKQEAKVEKVLQEYKQGDLKSGKEGAGPKVRTRQQAVAIALKEAGLAKKKTTNK